AGPARRRAPCVTLVGTQASKPACLRRLDQRGAIGQPGVARPDRAPERVADGRAQVAAAQRGHEHVHRPLAAIGDRKLVGRGAGREALVEQAVRDALPEWYERALLDSGVTAIGDPKVDVASLPDAGGELQFSIEVGVRPRAKLGEYRGLEVGRADADVP